MQGYIFQRKLPVLPQCNKEEILDVSVTEVNVTEDAAMTEQPSTSRKSVRKSCKYKSSKDDRKCIICNEIKYAKGRTVPLLGITLKKSEEGSHEAQKTLKEFAKIHLHNNNETYKESANRIILTTSITTLFAAMFPTINNVTNDFEVPGGRKSTTL